MLTSSSQPSSFHPSSSPPSVYHLPSRWIRVSGLAGCGTLSVSDQAVDLFEKGRQIKGFLHVALDLEPLRFRLHVRRLVRGHQYHLGPDRPIADPLHHVDAALLG